MNYSFRCKECNKNKDINVPNSEYYIPTCECGETMVRKWTKPNVSEGCLNGGNLAI